MNDLKRYKILKKIGEGGTSEVYAAFDKRTGKKVTVKVLKESGKGFFKERASMENEALMLKSLKHSGVQKLIDYGEGFMVLQYISGSSISEKLRMNGVFSEKETVEIAIELIRILKYLHGLKEPVIYRDLKPANIIIGRDGKVYLIDFGAARIYRKGEKSDTSYLGTVGFAAPEQYGTLGQTSPKTDIYCFGMTLLQMTTGIDIKNEAALENFKLNGATGLSEEFAKIINKCIKPGRDDRFRSCSEIEKALLTSIVKRKRGIVIRYMKRSLVAAALSAMVSMAIMYAEPVKNYVESDARERVPAFKGRLYNAKERIAEFIDKEFFQEGK
ncbi:MAG: serine/threonine protein kinase [Butyrivibrio sp.]|nr:serine/threonine protein kinase [Butyrivibrio sp.]